MILLIEIHELNGEILFVCLVYLPYTFKKCTKRRYVIEITSTLWHDFMCDFTLIHFVLRPNLRGRLKFKPQYLNSKTKVKAYFSTNQALKRGRVFPFTKCCVENNGNVNPLPHYIW